MIFTSVHECQKLGRWLSQQAAPAHPTVKFIQIVATRCIEGYPDANLPTVILYRKGNVQKQLLQASQQDVEKLIEQIEEAERELETKEPSFD